VTQLPLPRWQCRDERDVKAMTDWVNHELNLMDAEALRKDLRGENTPTDNVSFAIEQADNHISIERLRQAFPHLARFLQLPKRGHGERLRSRRYNPIKGAVADVERIRKLWKDNYGKTRRTTGPKAESIAADRWDIEADAVINALKKDAGKKAP
jgi:hypothetical protein